MSIQQIVDPGNIESELLRLWEGLAKEKMRACLFNLLVFNQLSPRTDYVRNIVQKVSEKYPCRVLFISSDPKAPKPYLKTAVSVVGGGNIACDYIDIGVAGVDMEQVPFLLLPHLIPDLPITLLWTEDPSRSHPLFEVLSKWASRIIFDSECADSLLAFSQKILKLKMENSLDTADLNWARTEGWRDLIASLFRSGEKLDQIKDIRITYNARETESFCHLKVQSLYLLSWIASRLKWKFKKATKDLHFTFEKQKDLSFGFIGQEIRDSSEQISSFGAEGKGGPPPLPRRKRRNLPEELEYPTDKSKTQVNGEICSAKWEKLGSGTVISIDLTTEDGCLYQCSRIPTQYHHVSIQISSPEKCELPYQFVLGKTATGQSLVKEIIIKGTSTHFLEMLKNLSQLDRDQLC